METFVITDLRAEVVFGTVRAISDLEAMTAAEAGAGFVDRGWGPLRTVPLAVHPMFTLADKRWREVAPLGPQSNGDCGGDLQESDSVSRRWAMALEDGRWAVCTVSIYAARTGYAEDSPRRLERHTEYTICRSLNDVGGTEEFGKYAYRAIDGDATYKGAFDACLALRTADVRWTGEEFYGTRRVPELPR